MDSTDKNQSLINSYLLGGVAALSGLLFGFDASIAASVGSAVNAYFNLGASPGLQGLWVAAVPLGALFGALGGGWVSNHLGRRRGLIGNALLFIVGILLAALAPMFIVFVFSRLLMGVAIGNSAVITPMYMAEVSPPENRGRILFLYQLSIVTGILFSFLVGVGVDFLIADISLNWRIMIAVGLLPAFLFLAGMFRMPYSPRWLMEKGREDEAKQILTRLVGRKEAQTTVNDINKAMSRSTSVDLKTLLSRTIFPVILLGFFLQFFQQTTGINADMYFGPEIFREGGFSHNASMWAQVVMGMVNLGATILSIFLVDKLGRRKLMFIGVGGIIVTLLLQAFLFQQYGLVENKQVNNHQIQKERICEHVEPNTHILIYRSPSQQHPILQKYELTYMIMASILLYIVFFAISAGPLCWLMISEIFPIHFRGIGMSIAVAANWLVDYFVSQLFPLMKDGLGMDITCLIYAGFTSVGLFLAFRFLPETKGVSLERIEQNIYAGKGLRHLGC